jgi:hypothetical protein
MKFADITVPDGQGGESPALRQLAMTAMVEECPILGVAQFSYAAGNSETKQKDNDVTTFGNNRALNADWTPVTANPDTVTASLKIIGGTINTDIANERRFPGRSQKSERARQLVRAAKSYGREFMSQFVNGDGSGELINGLTSIVHFATQVDSFNSAASPIEVKLGIDNTAKKSQSLLLNGIDRIIGKVNGVPDALIMNSTTISYLKAIARDYLTVSTVQGVFTNQEVVTYNGVPIINAGKDRAGTSDVIGNNYGDLIESEDNMTMIAAVKFGEDENLTLLTNVGLVVKDQGLIGTKYQTLCEMDVNTLLLNDKSVAILTNFFLN